MVLYLFLFTRNKDIYFKTKSIPMLIGLRGQIKTVVIFYEFYLTGGYRFLFEFNTTKKWLLIKIWSHFRHSELGRVRSLYQLCQNRYTVGIIINL